MNNQKPANVERSLLDEIEELHVLEAEELQEGVAFHAFRFASAEVSPQSAVILTLNVESATIADKTVLPHGATLLEVTGNKMLIAFDTDQIKVDDLKKAVGQSLGKSVASFDHDPNATITISKSK